MASIELRGLTKRFGRQTVIPGIDLEIADGEFMVVVGPSGCGKSTLLRLIAGLEEASGGEIRFDGAPVTGLPPARRGVAMVFQSYALYPHMTVYRNMAFGMRLARADRDEIDRRVREAAEILEILPLLDRLPKELSGGQRQRVAIGRAIVRDPRVFLFDEPLSNLDAALRGQTRAEIARLHERFSATMVYVTHDQTEAMTLADRICLLNEGRVEQIGTPLELYSRPASRFAAGFVGSPPMNFLDVEADASGEGALCRLPDGHTVEVAQQARGRVALGVRPETLRHAEDGPFRGRVELVEELGETHLLHLRGEAAAFIAKLPGPARHRVGETVAFAADAEALHLFDPDGARIG